MRASAAVPSPGHWCENVRMAMHGSGAANPVTPVTTLRVPVLVQDRTGAPTKRQQLLR